MRDITFLFGDCLKKLTKIKRHSVDLIIADMPYGVSACKWDHCIPMEPLWQQIWRIMRGRGAVIMFGTEPFSTSIRASALKHYCYDWYWDKKFGGNFVQATQDY